MSSATAAKNLTIKAFPRAERGKEKASAMRRTGNFPGVVYGAHKETKAVFFNLREFEATRAKTHGEKVLVDVQFEDGTIEKAFIQEVQREPVTRAILHADILRVSLTEVMTVSVPVFAVGLAAGVKNDGGVLEQVSRKIAIRCLPTIIPPHIDVDVTAMAVGQSLHVFDIPAIEGITFVDPKMVLFAVAHKAAEEVAVVATTAVTAPELVKKKEGDAATADTATPAKGAAGKAAAPAAKAAAPAKDKKK